jgi:predicted dehydrogenase
VSTARGQDTPVTVGVVGCGYWGPNVARNVAENPRAAVAAIADKRPERLEAVSRRFPGAILTTDPEAVIGDPAVEAVAVTTPVSSHFAIARDALDAGKHVFITKPMTTTVAEADALIALARERDRILLVDHTFVYTGAVRRIRRMLEEGELGELHYIDSVRINLGLFQHDVNVIWDLATHDFAILDHLLGISPLTVRAIGAAHSSSGLEDVAYVHLEYDDRLIAHVHVSWLSPVKIRQTLIGGSQRMLVWNDLAADEKLRVYDRGVELVPATEEFYESIVSYRTGDAWIPTLERHEALGLEIDHFVDCIRCGAEPLTGGAAGREVVRLLEATVKSLREGSQAVRLREPVEAEGR